MPVPVVGSIQVHLISISYGTIISLSKTPRYYLSHPIYFNIYFFATKNSHQSFKSLVPQPFSFSVSSDSLSPMESQHYSHVNINSNDEGTETLFRNRRGCLCFTWNTSTHPSSTSGLNWWQRIRTSDFKGNSLLSRGVNALKKVREWSEIVAGPRWKTFIRRFNRNNSKRLPVNYQYDALGYALNFDEGPGTAEESGEVEDYSLRNFSVRYAGIPASVNTSSVNLGKAGPS